MLEEFEVRDALGSVLMKKEGQIGSVYEQGSLGWTPPATGELRVPISSC